MESAQLEGSALDKACNQLQELVAQLQPAAGLLKDAGQHQDRSPVSDPLLPADCAASCQYRSVAACRMYGVWLHPVREMQAMCRILLLLTDWPAAALHRCSKHPTCSWDMHWLWRV